MATVDSLEIELKSNAKDVASGFNTLSKSIDKLSSGTKSLNSNLQSIANSFKNFAKELNTIDTKGLDKVNHLMDNISKTASKSAVNVSKVSKNINSSFDSSKIEKSKKSVDEFMASIKGLGQNQKFFGSGKQLEQEIESTRNKIEKVKVALEAYNQEGKSVETKGWRTAQRQLEQYSNYLDNLVKKQQDLALAKPTNFKFDEKAIAKSESNIYKLLLSDADYNKMREEILAKGTVEIPVAPKFEEGTASFGAVDTSKLDGMQQKMSQISDKAEEISKRTKLMFEPSTLGQGQKYTEEYKVLEKEIQKTEKELERYLNTQERMESLGVNKEGQRYKNVAMNIEQADAKLQLLYADMKALQADGKDIINPNQFDKMSEGASNAQNIMLSLSKALRAGGFGSAASSFQKLGADVGSLSGGMSQLGASAEGASGAMAGLQTAIPVIGIILALVTVAIKLFTSLAKAVINACKKIASAIKGVITKVKDLISNILSIGSSSYQAKTMVGKFIKRMVNMFKSRVLRMAITKAIQYMKDGFKSLDAYSNNIGSQFHNNVVMIITDFKWLGRTIAAAFEPLANVAFPLLDTLINKLVTVINYINQFFSALTGSQTWTKAVKTASDYAGATSGAAKSQKDLNKQIREWDKLNVITDPNKNNGGGGGGASGASGDGFVTEEVDNKIKNLAKKIKESWDTDADFTWLGTDIGNKVKETLDKIPWEEKIQPAAAKFGKALATTINGFVSVPGLADKIGHTIAEAINTMIITFDSFVTWIKGDKIGTFIGTLVGTALDDIEWDKYIHGMGKLGEELAKGINALVKTDVLSKISKAFANVLKGAIEGAYKFVTNLDFKELGKKVGKAITDFFKEMNEKGDDGKTGWEKLGLTVKGIVDGIQDFFKNLKDNVDMGEIKQGVSDFLSSAFDPEEMKGKLKEKFKEAITKSLTLDNIFGGSGEVTAGFNLGKKLGEKAQEGWNEFFKETKLKIEAKIPDIKAKIEEKWNEFTTWWADKKADFKMNLPAWDGDKGLKSKFESLVSKIKSILKATFSISAPTWDKIKSGFESLQSKIKQLLTLNFSIKVDAKAQKITTTVTGGAVSNAASKAVTTVKKATKKTKKKANGGIYAHGSWKNIPKYAEGGFPTHGSAFIAGEHGAELVGHINGHTEVLNQSQLANVMASSMSSANAEQNAILKQQNQLLLQILQKETGISYKDVFNAARKGNNEYKMINGVSAYI